MNRLTLTIIILLSSIGTMFSQQHELGFSIGGANYIGDIGRETYFYPNKLSGGLYYTSVINPWFSGRLNFNYIGLEANDLESESLGRRTRQLSFSGSALAMSVGIEYKFFPRNPYLRSKGYRRFTPYMFTGISMSMFSGDIRIKEGNPIALEGATTGIPMLLGVKYKISEHFLIAVEASANYYFTDNLDGTQQMFDGKNRIKKEAFLKTTNLNSNDWSTYTSFSLIYTFGDLRCYFGF